MEADKLEILLGKYYSGDILPDEYQNLLSILKDVGELTPELEAERSVLLAIESCEPSEPDGFEDRLIEAINHRSKKRRLFLRMVYSGSAAAIALILITTGLYIHDNKTINNSEPIAKISDSNEVVRTNETLEKKGTVNVIQVISVAQKNPSSCHNAKKELEKSTQIVDEALMDVLASIHLAQNEAIDAIDNIEISQTTDYNIL